MEESPQEVTRLRWIVSAIIRWLVFINRSSTYKIERKV